MSNIEVIKETNKNKFEDKVNTYLSWGYKLTSSDCKITDDSEEHGIWQAILYKED